MTVTEPVHLETLQPPGVYPPVQIAVALQIAAILQRGKFVLCEVPQR
jgi:hypothetical protein